MKLFGKASKNKKVMIVPDEVNVDEKLDTLLLIMENLGFLNSYEIEKSLEEKQIECDKSILYRLRISLDAEDISCLRNQFPPTYFGYGSAKIKLIKERFGKIKLEQEVASKNNYEIVEELIFEAKLEISRYEKILKDLNIIIKRLQENYKLTELDRLAMIDYWVSFYKEEKLGFPINVEEKIKSLINSLRNLQYGGYGEIELKRFEKRCFTTIEKAKKNNQDINQVFIYIEENIYNPLKNRYQNDLEILKKRIYLIENSVELNQKEKDIKKEEFIIDFKERNGHPIDLSSQLQDMKKKLKELKYGGYGPNVIDKFINFAQELIVREKNNNKTDKAILSLIRLEFVKTINWYQKKQNQLEEKIRNTSDILQKEKLIREFKNEMGQPINLKRKTEKMVAELMENNYSEEEIREFTRKCQKVEEESIFNEDIKKAAQEIDDLYEVLVTKASESNKDSAILQEKLSIFADDLKTLNNHGYGEKAVEEFVTDCEEVIESNNDFNEKLLIIARKFEVLSKNYFENLRIFTIWKNEELKKGKEAEETLDSKVNYLLSLSPSELHEYYEEDDRRKRQEMQNNNNRILVKYLASKEAKEKGNNEIIKDRLKDLESGFIPYIAEELEQAREEIEKNEFFGDEIILEDDEKLISISDYIDNTLFKQISNIKSSLYDKSTEEN